MAEQRDTLRSAPPSDEVLESRQRVGRVAWWAPVAAMTIFSVAAARQPLWRDELATLAFARLDPADLWRAVSHVDMVMVPYYFLSHVMVTGIGEWALRLPSILAGVATVALVARVARIEWGDRAGVAAAWVIALNPLAVVMAATARPYALAMALVALAACFVQAAVAKGGRIRWFGYAAAAVAAGYAHLFAILAILPTALWAIGAPRRRQVATVASLALSLLALVPFALITAGQRDQVSWIRLSGAREVLGALGSVAAFRRDNLLGPPEGLSLLLVAGGVGLAIAARTRQELVRTLPATAAAAGIVLVPWALLLVASLVTDPVLRTTYLAPSVVGLGLMIGMVWGTPPTSQARASRSAAMISTALAVALSATFVAQEVRASWRVDDFHGAVRSVAREAQVGDTLVVVQLRNEVGVASGVARASGDVDYDAELQRALPDGAQPVVDVRRITATAPLRSVASRTDGSLEASAWFVYTRGAVNGDVRGALDEDGLECGSSVNGTGVRYGLLVVEQVRCGSRG